MKVLLRYLLCVYIMGLVASEKKNCNGVDVEAVDRLHQIFFDPLENDVTCYMQEKIKLNKKSQAALERKISATIKEQRK